MHNAGSPLAPELEGSPVDRPSAEVAIPLQHLPGQKTDAREGLPLASALESTRTAPDLPPIDRRGFLTLMAQHVSSSWNARSCEFAFYLFLIELFPNTLLLASVYGFVSTGIAILLAGWIGSLVDSTPRLRIVRIFIAIQKLSITVVAAAFIGLFVVVKPVDYHDAPAAAWVAFAIIAIFGSILNLSSIGINVAIERDWVTSISKSHKEGTLTTLNAYMRRIDLLTKLLAPLFTSLLTTVASYTFATTFLMGFAGTTLLFEIFWVQVVYRTFPILQQSDRGVPEPMEAVDLETPSATAPETQKAFSHHLFSTFRDWQEFSKMPVFASSISISLLYLTVLSFDGTMLSWLKTKQFSDPFIAGQRAICVVTGLAGTILMPFLERRLGLVRAGAWSICSELLCLVPAVATFYLPVKLTSHGPAWVASLLFGGVAASRIGLWAFDLVQLKELQLSLDNHPKRNRFMGLQFSMQNMADLFKYIATMILSQPAQFRWAALISFIAVLLGVLSYTVYVRLERGHVFHPDRIPLLRKYV